MILVNYNIRAAKEFSPGDFEKHFPACPRLPSAEQTVLINLAQVNKIGKKRQSLLYPGNPSLLYNRR